MATAIKIIAQHYEVGSGEILEENVLRTDLLEEAKELKDLGYLHFEQIDLMAKCQEFKISRQIKLINDTSTCPKCGEKVHKKGNYTSKFHAMYSDHSVTIKRVYCTRGCDLPYTVEGLYGNTTHPELLKKQAELASNTSYVKASYGLNYDSESDRAIHNRTHLSRVVVKVARGLEDIKTKEQDVPDIGVKELVVNIDGGHIKNRGEGRSFEAMIASIYQPSNIRFIDKNHNEITRKQVVSSAKNDSQESIKKQFKNACIVEGMGSNTNITCLADGADNCWSISESISSDCSSIISILDWFHIGMKFKNNLSAVPDQLKDSYEKVKWHLWHGNAEKSLSRLDKLIMKITDNPSLNKLSKLKTYISNNADKIVNYEKRKNLGLVFSSSPAESTVNDLINVRQKNKQRMTWTRDGAHSILQIRSSIMSKSWDKDWEKVEDNIYKKVA